MRIGAACALALTVAACTSTAAPSPSPTVQKTEPPATATPALFTPAADAMPVEGGCGRTTVVRGSVSATLETWTGNNAPAEIPYAVAHPATAAGFIFGYPLHTASSGIAYGNKILWVVGTARTGDLVVEGTPLGKTAPTVRYSFPANSGPGEIYPSGVDVPEPGCWAFTLRWAGQVAQIELLYR